MLVQQQQQHSLPQGEGRPSIQLPTGEPQPIYPTGAGHYALGIPDGPVLRQNEMIRLYLAGQQISGYIRWSANGDHIETLDHSICGLYPTMRVAIVPVQSGQAEPEPTQLAEAREPRRRGPRGKYQPRFRWTAERLQTLRERYLDISLQMEQEQGYSTGLYVIGRCIAEEQDWPIQSTQNKLWQLRSTLRQRLAVARFRRRSSQLHAAEEQQPLELVCGQFLWTIQQSAQKHTSWLLDYPYGEFPAAAGQHCVYRDVAYCVERVWTSQLRVRRIEPVLVQEEPKEPSEEREALDLLAGV